MTTAWGRIACAAVVAMMACDSGPRLADGPIDITEGPKMVRFHRPVEASGLSWELCFEFDLPGDSHSASAIEVALVSSSGGRFPLIDPTLDRRGESIVCQITGLPATVPGEAPEVYDGVVLSSSVPIRLRGLSGGPSS